MAMPPNCFSVKGDKVVLPSGQNAILNARPVPGLDGYRSWDSQPCPTIIHYRSDCDIKELGNNIFEFKIDKVAVESCSISQVDQLSAAFLWVGTHPSVGHSRGSVDSRDNNRWFDNGFYPTSGHTCYGPYVRLTRGVWLYSWYVSVQAVTCRGVDDPSSEILIGYVDVVTDLGRTVITPTKSFGRYEPLCKDYGGNFNGRIYDTFKLEQDTDRVEVRLDLWSGLQGPGGGRLANGWVCELLKIESV
jgi:hypothetical protein